MKVKITIVGLGLMGASLAQALKGFKESYITGVDVDSAVLEKSLTEGMVDNATDDILAGVTDADLVIFSVYAKHIPKLLKSCIASLKPGVIITDICGVKQDLYAKIMPVLPEDAAYVGIHPMAGKERDGIENATASLYQNSSMLICPTPASTSEAINLMEEIAKYIGCSRIQQVSCELHDAIIAYTSDLIHIASAGLCIHFHPDMNLAFTAGAFKDATRIADINAEAWTEMLFENQKNVLDCLDVYIEDLQQIRIAVLEKDEVTLTALLNTAGHNKREILTR